MSENLILSKEKGIKELAAGSRSKAAALHSVSLEQGPPLGRGQLRPGSLQLSSLPESLSIVSVLT